MGEIKGVTHPISSIIEEKAGTGSDIDRIENLKKALTDVNTQIDKACKESYWQVIIILCICILLIIGVTLLVCYFIKVEDYPLVWSWQMIYYTATRIIIVTAVFSISSFCFQLLKSYLHIHQRNKHRRLVIYSMASLVESNSTYLDRQKVYNTLLDIIVTFDKTGILKNEDNFKLDIKQYTDLLKQLKDN